MATYSNVVAAAAELASESCCRVKWCKKRKMYECTRCGYASERKSNVGRHFRRIHCELQKHKVCAVCEMSFSTKGEFYEHCEKDHPHLRNSCFITSEKYKIGRKPIRRRRNQVRSTQSTRAASKRASIDETSEEEDEEEEDEEEEASDNAVCDNEKESEKSVGDPTEVEEVVDHETVEEMEECKVYEENEDIGEQIHIEEEIVESVDNNVDIGLENWENWENNYATICTSEPQEVDMRKVIVEEISQLYAPFSYEMQDDDSSSWSHKANDSLTSSPVRSLRTDFLSPVLWTPTSYKLPTTPSSPGLDDRASSPAHTIKTDDFLFSPARSVKTDNSMHSPTRPFESDYASSECSDASDGYLSSPEKLHNTNEFISSTPNAIQSSSEYSPKTSLSLSFSYCIMSSSHSDVAMNVNTSSSLRTLPLKKRFGNFTHRKHLADITNVQNNEFNVKSRFNNNEIQANRNFSAANEHQEAYFKNIDFDDLEAVLILKSLKESNH